MSSSGRRKIKIKCSRNLCESESVINTIIYSLLIGLLAMTIVGYKKQPETIKDSTNKTDTETQTVFLKCFIQLTESDKEAVPWIQGRIENENSESLQRRKRNYKKMKRKYKNRKRRSYTSDRKSRLKRDNNQYDYNYRESRDGDQEGFNRFINCSIYPSHKVVT
jgi:hypothetical protein